MLLVCIDLNRTRTVSALKAAELKPNKLQLSSIMLTIVTCKISWFINSCICNVMNQRVEQHKSTIVQDVDALVRKCKSLSPPLLPLPHSASSVVVARLNSISKCLHITFTLKTEMTSEVMRFLMSCLFSLKGQFNLRGVLWAEVTFAANQKV